MLHACRICGRLTDQKRCPQHRGKHTGWSPTRDRAKQAAFRAAVLKRDGHRCTHIDMANDQRCTNTTDLRAAHITPLAQGGSYHPDNGRTLCETHDRQTDRYAR